jgi:coenzyme F420-dependent glucose-6-phosphate dehydrogenase
MRIGYTLSSEERTAQELIDLAAKAEAVGFDFVGISDHYHPWSETQGQSTFAWTILGGIAMATRDIEVFIEVTCPIIRYHPAIIAQAAATTASLMEGRFTFGVGTGENLNEHVVGHGWPKASVRQEMLREAVDIIRDLWRGELTSYEGEFYTVENAKIYTLPAELPPIVVSAFGVRAARMAGEIGDGFVSTSPDKALVQAFRRSGGKNKPTYAQLDVCYAPTKSKAQKTAFKYWPSKLAPGNLNTELQLPQQYQDVAEAIGPEGFKDAIPLGNNVDDYVKAIKECLDAGFENVYLHQIGPDQASFFTFFKEKLQPALKNI